MNISDNNIFEKVFFLRPDLGKNAFAYNNNEYSAWEGALVQVTQNHFLCLKMVHVRLNIHLRANTEHS